MGTLSPAGAVETAGKLVQAPPARTHQRPTRWRGPAGDVVKVFDLGTQSDLHVNVRDLVEHVYDDSLRDKLVLPADQRACLMF